jgi:hypothetical protein
MHIPVLLATHSGVSPKVAKVGPRMWLEEGDDLLAAYHELHIKVIG